MSCCNFTLSLFQFSQGNATWVMWVKFILVYEIARIISKSNSENNTKIR